MGAIKVQVEGGSTFSDALRRHPKVFDDLYVNMVHAGEVGGLLDTILGRLSKYIEKAMKLKGQIKSAMVYPASILGIAFIVIAVLMIFVIPVFEKMFKDMSGGKVALPGPTQLVIDMSNFAQSSWYIILGGVILGVVRSKILCNGQREVPDRQAAPQAACFWRFGAKASVAKFTNVGNTHNQRRTLLDALTICAKTSGNKIIEEALVNARVSISGGKTISSLLQKSGIPEDGDTHDRGRRINGCARCHARKNCRFLRGRGGSGSCLTDRIAGTDDDGFPRSPHRMHCGGHVSAYLHNGQCNQVMKTDAFDLQQCIY